MNDLLRYRRERLPAALVVTVAVLLTIAAALGSARVDSVTFSCDVLMAVVLVVQFRLWDDLADAAHDRVQFPNRVLCQVERHNNFWLVVLVLFAFNGVAIWCLKSLTATVTHLALNALFLAWYHMVRGYFDKSLNAWFVLTKYPVLVFILADPSQPMENKTRVFASTAIVYVAACLYEVLHNSEVRNARRNP